MKHFCTITNRNLHCSQTNNVGTNTGSHVTGSNGTGPVMKQMISYQTPDGSINSRLPPTNGRSVQLWSTPCHRIVNTVLFTLHISVSVHESSYMAGKKPISFKRSKMQLTVWHYFLACTKIFTNSTCFCVQIWPDFSFLFLLIRRYNWFHFESFSDWSLSMFCMSVSFWNFFTTLESLSKFQPNLAQRMHREFDIFLSQ